MVTPDVPRIIIRLQAGGFSGFQVEIGNLLGTQNEYSIACARRFAEPRQMATGNHRRILGHALPYVKVLRQLGCLRQPGQLWKHA